MAGQIDVGLARDLTTDLGFLLVPGAPFANGPSYLIVAIRPTPTLRHFDPERVDYWATVEQRGLPVSADWPTRVPESSDFAWGMISVVDRLGIANDYVAFGGQLDSHRFDDVKVLVFRSDAPIVARGGHSQEWAIWSHQIAAFLARLRAAADPRGAFERRLAMATPNAIYAAFISDRLAVVAAGDRRARWSPADRTLLEAERRRLAGSRPEDWAAGRVLVHELEEARSPILPI